jgi:predicted exporter
VIVARVREGRAFDTDIQSLLPQSAIEPVIRAAMTDAGDAAARRVAVLVSAEDPQRALDAAADLEAALVAANVFHADRSDGEEMGRWLFANRNQLLCDIDPARFDGAATARRSLVMLYSPMTPVSGELLKRDPFLLTLQLSQCLAPSGMGGSAILVSGRLENSSFRLDVQDAVGTVYDAWRARWPDVHVARAGAVFHAREGARQARGEVSLIGTVSLVAIVLCLIVCFRRPEAIAGTMAVTAAGASGSLGAALLVFPSVHVLVLVFGSALIGVTSDYALHYLATGPQMGWAPVEERVRRVFRPLLVCAAATALGFASLALFHVPIFDQVAVFSVAGIATAWLFTLTLLPLMDIRARAPEKLSAWWRKLEAPLLRIRWTRAGAIASVVFVVVAVVAGAARFSALDDVRQFQPRSPVLTAEEGEVREAVGFSATPSFLLSYAETPDEARVREEAVLAAMPEDVARDILATSRFDPSLARRALNEATLRQKLYAPLLAERRAMLGADVNPFALSEAEPPQMIAGLSGRANEVAYLIAPLGGHAAASEGVHAENALIVDPAERYSRAFADYRVFASWAVAAAFGVCAIIVLALYRTWRALTILIGPAVGVAMGVAIPLALGVPISFFSVVALFVVIGTGIDHAVFQFEAAETGGEPMELAVLLAALTTILSMGLLGLSGTYPVQSFGLAVAAGVTSAYVSSSLPGRFGGRKA